MPARLNARTARDFLRDVEPFLSIDRPQLVLDLSEVLQLDAAGVEVLLHCMSEAHKRDGDVKLASPSPHAAVVLELTRTERLFEIYETSVDAVRSFSGFLPNALRQQLLHKRPRAA
jgi:anti-sigma B factor antagonist